ncbi:hypothetical protein [uncultured Alsobacter sp.]|uniref:hypothetical protein n=1 Tax=uncultured Alsobacter sp. TaxID=1748258 RepID=UPI0025D63446|nr:hypothetical protein [uncultured Alsobacter sp.]
MSDFGKRKPEAPGPVKRSQNVPFKMMAGAGAAALGVYAIAPNSSCPQGRMYDTIAHCISDGKIGEQLCRDGFAKSGPNGAGVIFGGGRGGAFQPLTRNAAGFTTYEDGVTPVALGEVCRPGQSRSSSSSSRSHFGGSSSSSSGSSGSSGRGWFSAFSGGDSSTSSSSSGGDGGHSAVSRGGFGSSGHAFSGGGG